MKIFSMPDIPAWASTPLLECLVPAIAASDLVLIEGFKNGNFSKRDVWRASEGKDTRWPEWPAIVANCQRHAAGFTGQVAVTPGLTRLDLHDVPAIADLPWA